MLLRQRHVAMDMDEVGTPEWRWVMLSGWPKGGEGREEGRVGSQGRHRQVQVGMDASTPYVSPDGLAHACIAREVPEGRAERAEGRMVGGWLLTTTWRRNVMSRLPYLPFPPRRAHGNG